MAIACNNLGSLLQDRGRYEEAERQLLRAWKLRSELSGETHAETLKARFNRAANLWRWRGQPGLDEFAALMPLARESFGPRSRGLAHMLLYYGVCLQRSNRLAEARPILHEAFERSVEVFGGDSRPARTVAKYLAALYEAQGDKEQAALWRGRESGKSLPAAKAPAADAKQK